MKKNDGHHERSVEKDAELSPHPPPPSPQVMSGHFLHSSMLGTAKLKLCLLSKLIKQFDTFIY